MNTTEVALSNPSQQGRSVTEMLVGALAMTAATTIAAGYLTTLRRQSAQFASYQVLATIFILIVMRILHSVYLSVRIRESLFTKGKEIEEFLHLTSIEKAQTR